MEEGGFIDLKNRPGKAGGGFCTSFPTLGAPFIFANFNGTHHDIGVFTHEMGHAFQNWESRFQPGIDYLWPTMEAAEIHSMSLEFLTHPHMGLLVGEDAAERFRRMHLETSLAFLPYGVCVDHFQHEVYANPEATPAERHAIWQRLERRYMPWTDYGDLAYPAMGGRWQAKPHIYRSPFYYIDYTLAPLLRAAVLGAVAAAIRPRRWRIMSRSAAVVAQRPSPGWSPRPGWPPPSRPARWRRWCGRRRRCWRHSPPSRAAIPLRGPSAARRSRIPPPSRPVCRNSGTCPSHPAPCRRHCAG